MNLPQAKEIIQSHLDWVDGDEQEFSKYNEKAFNDALRVLLSHKQKVRIVYINEDQNL